ncbi:MAG: two-component regulator propeller domain-containing protein [Hymenobacter sp.]
MAALLSLRALAGVAGPGPRAPQAFVRHFGPEQGLRQPFIYCLLQDRQGYLWLGTAEGLVRYDGRRFATLTTHDGLAENFATGLWQDPATGALWVAHDQERSLGAAGCGPAFPARAGRAARRARQSGRRFRPRYCPPRGVPAALSFGPTPRRNAYLPACSKTAKATPGSAPPATASGGTPTVI